MPQVISVQMKPVQSYRPHVQIAFGAICQHVDWLRRQVPVPTCAQVKRVSHKGSESWEVWNGSHNLGVLLKVVPWDERIVELHDFFSCTEGISIWIRNSSLSARGMQTLWDILKIAYYPCPANPLFAVRTKPDVPFQSINYFFGKNGCNVLGLPGVDIRQILVELANRNVAASGDDANDVDEKDWPTYSVGEDALEEARQMMGDDESLPFIEDDYARLADALSSMIEAMVSSSDSSLRC